MNELIDLNFIQKRNARHIEKFITVDSDQKNKKTEEFPPKSNLFLNKKIDLNHLLRSKNHLIRLT